MPRVLLVVVAFAAATTALPHRLRRAKPEKSAADDHAPKPRTPSLAALESFLGGTAAEPVSRTLDGLDPEVALERASLTGMAREVGIPSMMPDWDTVDGEEFSVLMEVGRTFRSSRGELVGPDVAQGKVACDKNRKWEEKLREAELEAEAYETAEGRPAYETLGLPETATAAEIKQKYEELLRALPKFKKMQEYKKAKDIALAVAQKREDAGLHEDRCRSRGPGWASRCCKKLGAGGHGQVFSGQARIRVHEKSKSIFSSAVTDTDFTGSVVIKQSIDCLGGSVSDVTKEKNILRHLQKNRDEAGGANLMNVYGFYTMNPSGGAEDDYAEWKCDIIAEKVPYEITWETAWNPKAVGQLLRQALLGLSFMHNHHTAHLDLKPENMMSHTDPRDWFNKEDHKLAAGTIKLIDTGGGEENRKKMHWFEGKFTRETDVASPIYFAPELKEFVTSSLPLREREKVEIKPYKADIWSMGIVAVALLCGKNMLIAPEDIDSQDAVADYIDTISTAVNGWNTVDYKDAREFVNAALKYDPDERKTAAQLLKMRFVAA